MSTKNLLARAGNVTQPQAKEEPVIETPEKVTATAESLRIKKTITLDPKTVKALHKLKAHISVEEDTQTDFGRIIDEAVSQLLKSKGLNL